MDTIRNPIEWSMDKLREAGTAFEEAGDSIHGQGAVRTIEQPKVRRIAVRDLQDCLLKGIEDFGVYRTDVMFLCIMYPVISAVLIHAAFNQGMLDRKACPG